MLVMQATYVTLVSEGSQDCFSVVEQREVREYSAQTQF